nr:MAG TPA: hypothetical protein [Caudoviricetes sp.]
MRVLLQALKPYGRQKLNRPALRLREIISPMLNTWEALPILTAQKSRPLI